jgi:hypothetical protein
MRAFLDEFEFEVLDPVVVEVVWYFSGAIDDVHKFVILQKLIILGELRTTCMVARVPR